MEEMWILMFDVGSREGQGMKAVGIIFWGDENLRNPKSQSWFSEAHVMGSKTFLFLIR